MSKRTKPRPSKLLHAVDARKAQQRLRDAASPSGSASVSPVLKLHIPAPTADPRRRRQRGFERRRCSRCSSSSATASRLASRADQDRQVRHGGRVDPFEHNALFIDQRQLAVVLPDRGRLTFDNVHHQSIGQAPRNARFLDPAILQQTRCAPCRDQPAASPSNAGQARSHRPVSRSIRSMPFTSTRLT